MTTIKELQNEYEVTHWIVRGLVAKLIPGVDYIPNTNPLLILKSGEAFIRRNLGQSKKSKLLKAMEKEKAENRQATNALYKNYSHTKLYKKYLGDKLGLKPEAAALIFE